MCTPNHPCAAPCPRCTCGTAQSDLTRAKPPPAPPPEALAVPTPAPAQASRAAPSAPRA